ncbi:hypothetical protein VNI00_016757 [Paramarasmius palmivorus]|uniref:Uncharacterized protein n=1 Tax=Paramarasmius palmivorus TaxID=297713 RepID=A0AAW0BAZ5_9AGAR
MASASAALPALDNTACLLLYHPNLVLALKLYLDGGALHRCSFCSGALGNSVLPDVVLLQGTVTSLQPSETRCQPQRQDYPSDPIRLKVMVGTTLVLDTTHQVMLCHLLYTYLITNYGKPVVLGELIWSILVRFHRVDRATLLGMAHLDPHKNRPVTILILLLIFAEFGVTLAYFGCSTGLLTTVCAILSLITITVLPNTFIYITFYSTLARFYSTSFLATLNARAELRAANKTGKGNTFIGSVSLTFDPPGSSTIGSRDTGSRTHPERQITIKQNAGLVHTDSDIELDQIGDHAV